MQGLREAGMIDDAMVSMGISFHGGIAALQEVCGAFAGGVMALGFQMRGMGQDYKDRKKLTDLATRRLSYKFRDLAGDIYCRVITGLDFKDPEQLKTFRETVSKTKCRPLAEAVVKLVLTTKSQGGVLPDE